MPVMQLRLLVSPLARGAYFDAYLDVARAELRAHLPGVDVASHRVGGLDLFAVEADEAALPALARLSFIQGVFLEDAAGGLVPLELEPGFLLPEALVFGAKYQGKTNELMTQLAINLGLRYCATDRSEMTLLDPLAGRGTTLLWGLRYGLDATGIEQDPEAPRALHNHVKRQAKLHRIKHSHHKGFVAKKNKRGAGAFVRYELAGHSLRLITGDSARATDLLAQQRFDLVVSDLPYGVRFKGGARRGPQELIAACADGWLASLRKGGAMVLVFNAYQPGRDELMAAFARPGYTVEEVSIPHRMSESIVRDLLVVTRDPGASRRPAVMARLAAGPPEAGPPRPDTRVDSSQPPDTRDEGKKP